MGEDVMPEASLHDDELEVDVCQHCGGYFAWTDRQRKAAIKWGWEPGGEDASGNMFPVHAKCHRAHTSETDVPAIAKAKRREAKHLGVKKPRTIRAWRKFDGTPVYADRERD